MSSTSVPLAATSASNKRDAILQAALQLFAERGYHGTAMPELAQRAGVGTGTIYRYFDSKEVLVNAVFQQSKRLLRDHLVKDIDLAQPARTLFHTLWQSLIQFARAFPQDFRFLELQDHVPYLDTDSRNIELEVLAPIWAWCVSARRAGTSRDMPAEALMALVWGAFVGLLKAEHTGHIKLDDSILAAAEEACWAAFSASQTATMPQ